MLALLSSALDKHVAILARNPDLRKQVGISDLVEDKVEVFLRCVNRSLTAVVMIGTDVSPAATTRMSGASPSRTKSYCPAGRALVPTVNGKADFPKYPQNCTWAYPDVTAKRATKLNVVTTLFGT